ncbi:hypothetical protein F2Q70_00020143 [Brassica cretica]|uniref:Uncharacterized protein n=1 Tax=Brassica cretica TaxID=69181 RepID=A0A8S9GI23_BRACR|nr:hypothetical protein F2Q70_00020143 [Brassica cretica]
MRFNNNNDNIQRKTNETSVSFGGFRCYGPCYGVKTVNTERKNSSKGGNNDRDYVAYDPRKHINKPRPRLEARKADYPEPQRSDIAMNLERKLSMHSWDAIPNHISTKNNNGNNSSSFLSHPALGELLTEEDQKIFKYLSSLDVEDAKDHFNPNPYFEDEKLTKTFTFLEEGTTKITATPIKWKEGKGLPNGVNHEKNGNKRALPEESFFTWFSDAQHKEDLVVEINDET